MRFNVFASALALTATAYAAAVPATITPDQVVLVLQGLTAKAAALQNPVNLINDASALAFLTGGGPLPSVVAGIQDIAVNAQGLATLLQSAQNIPTGNPAAAVIAAYQQFAQVQQQVLTILNSKLAQFPGGATVAAPLNAALNNLQVALTNLFNQLTARLATQAPPVQAPQNAIQSILTQLLSTVTGLLGGLNLQDVLGGLLGGGIPVIGGGAGGATGGLPALPFNLPISGLISGLNIGTIPILGQLLGGVTGGTGNPTGILGGLLGGILAKRVEAY